MGIARHSTTQRRLTITAIALRRFELAEHRLPENLEELVPRFLSVVPMDLMSAKPMCYRRKPERGLVLFSVGQDGKDDGGDMTSTNKMSQFEWWSGRDIVWPEAAD